MYHHLEKLIELDKYPQFVHPHKKMIIYPSIYLSKGIVC